MGERIQLTFRQTKALEMIQKGENILVTGGAGTGKTVLLRACVEQLKLENKNLLLCASTGMAAELIGGTTIHRAFGFGRSGCINETTMKLRTNAGEILCHTDAVLIDEISMVRMDLMDAVMGSIRKAEKKSGRTIQLILFGDFYQLPPVIAVQSNDRQLLNRYYGRDIGKAYAFQADMWADFNIRMIELTETMRQKDHEMAEQLASLRQGILPDMEYFMKNMSPGPIRDAPWLFPFLKQAEQMNNQAVDMLPGELYRFKTEIRGDIRESDLNVPMMLYLKIGARVMLTVNESDFGRKKRITAYHNGSTGTVEAVTVNPADRIVRIRLDNGRLVDISRQSTSIYKYVLQEDGTIVKTTAGTYTQYPLRLAYALTIHKAQGQTYDRANIDVGNCFLNGQLYTALSRVKDIHGLYILGKISEDKVRIDPAVHVFHRSVQSIVQDDDFKENEQEKEAAVKKPGRRPRFLMGSSTLRIPDELIPMVQLMIDDIYPRSMVGRDEFRYEKLKMVLMDQMGYRLPVDSH